MPRLVICKVLDRPDGLFDVTARLDGGRVYRRAGLRTRASADACVEMLRSIMGAYGAPLTLVASAPGGPLSESRSGLSSR